MKSDAQPLLPMPGARPEGPPRRIRLAVDANGFACTVTAGSANDNAVYWDLHHPTCAPHYVANFQEVIE